MMPYQMQARPPPQTRAGPNANKQQNSQGQPLSSQSHATSTRDSKGPEASQEQ